MEFKNNSLDTARVTSRIVLAKDIDELGHVNNAVYVNWIQEASTEHWQAIAAQSIQDKYLWFCSRHEIDYKQQLYIEQDVEIRTWLGQAIGARFDRFVDIREKGSKSSSALAKTTWVLISKSSGRPIRIKPEILAAFY